MKKTLSLVLILSMIMSLLTFGASASGAVAMIGDTPYNSLAEAVAAANTDTTTDTVEIKLVADTTFDSALTISRNITISGAKTVTRGETYTGAFASVTAGVTLTLNALTIDGNNNWTFDAEGFKALASSGNRLSNDSVSFMTPEEGAPVASGTLISVSGKVIMNGSSIKNHYGCRLFWVGNGAELTMNAATIDHNAKYGTPLVASVDGGGLWTINEGTVISNNHSHAGNGLLSYLCGKAVMNGGEIFNNTGVDCNGCVMMIYGGSSHFVMNGGRIYNNGATYGSNNGWNPAFYVYGNGSTFEMNGGTIEGNYSSSIPGIANNGSNATIKLNGGNIINTVSGRGYSVKDICAHCPVEISGENNSATNRFYNNITNTGVLTGDSWFYTNEMTYSGGGTFNGDVTVQNGAETTMADGSWIGGIVYVKAVGNDSTLTVKEGATIDGTQVRVLASVESGDYKSSEAAAAQSAALVIEEGAEVVSPVLYYHRLSSAQQKGIVVTFDYNGGLDASGWSGCQITSETAFETLPLPQATRKGYVIAGWEYAIDNNPESLLMDGLNSYNGEAVSETVRLVAVWKEEFTPSTEAINGKVVFEGTLYPDLFTFVLLGDTDNDGEIDDVIATTTNDKDGNFSFDVKIEAEGSYNFVVDQIEGGGDIIYDRGTFDVTINVDNRGLTEVTSESIVFVNGIVSPASVPVSGNVYLDGEAADDFTFILSGEGTTVRATSENGVFDFGSFEFDEEGIYTYDIYQVVPSDKGNVNYDENSIEIQIIVTKGEAAYLASMSIKRASSISFFNTTFHVHTEEVIEGKAPTCTETGLTDGVRCPECGETLAEQEEIDALGHTEEVIEGKAPTCTETGLTDGVRCSVCGETLVAQEEIPAKGHVPGDEIIENVVEATETEGGSYEIAVYCTVCGAELSREYYITDPLTPKDPAPETTEPEVTEPEVEITDPEIPLDPAPDTGDNTLIIILAAIASLALGVVYIKRRQTTEE